MIIPMKAYLLTFFILTFSLNFSLFSQTTPLITPQEDFSQLNKKTHVQDSPIQEQNHEPDFSTHPSTEDSAEPTREHPPVETDNFQSKFLNMLFILGLLIGFMILASRLLKRMTQTRLNQINTTSAIKILETRHLSAKSTLYLIEVMGQGLVIAETHTAVSHLATVPLHEIEKL